MDMTSGIQMLLNLCKQMLVTDTPVTRKEWTITMWIKKSCSLDGIKIVLSVKK